MTEEMERDNTEIALPCCTIPGEYFTILTDCVLAEKQPFNVAALLFNKCEEKSAIKRSYTCGEIYICPDCSIYAKHSIVSGLFLIPTYWYILYFILFSLFLNKLVFTVSEMLVKSSSSKCSVCLT